MCDFFDLPLFVHYEDNGHLSIQHYDRELHPETRGPGYDRYFLQCIRVIVHEPVVERRHTLVARATTVVAGPTAVERDRGQAAIETVGDSERRQSDVVVAAATTAVLLPPQPHERCTWNLLTVTHHTTSTSSSSIRSHIIVRSPTQISSMQFCRGFNLLLSQ